MEKLTTKQFNYLITLGKQEKEIKDLTIKEASILIAKTLKENKQQEAPLKAVKKEFTTQDKENLLKKYNASYSVSNEGIYNKNKGSNSKSDLLSDSRKFKTFISNIIKNDLGLTVKNCSCSFRHYYNEHIDITIEAPKSEIFKDFESIVSDYDSQYNSFKILRSYFWAYPCNNWDSLEQATELRIYNLYIKNICHSFASYGRANSSIISALNESFLNKLSFIHELLRSFSYDNSSYETDYFDHGLVDNITFEANDANEAEKKEFEETLKRAKNEKDILIKYPVTDEESAELKKAVNIYREEAEKRSKEWEEQAALRKAENERWIQEQKKNNEFITENVEIIKLEETRILKGARFSSWNKPATLDEAKEYVESYPEGGNIGTIAEVKEIINFKDEKAFNLFTEALLNDYEFLKGVNCGCGHVDYDTLEEKNYQECYYMSNEEQEAKNIAWMRGSVIIALNGEDQFLVDTEGASYCRYVGFLPDGSRKAPIKNDKWRLDGENKPNNERLISERLNLNF